MSQSFSTEALPASDRIDAWQWNAQQICGDCRIQLPKSSFHGSIEIRSVDGLRLTRFSSTPLSFWKWPLDTVTADNRSCIVITQIAGVRRYLQNGVSVLLKPGDTTVIDSGSPWSSSCVTNCTRLYFRVPRWIMENRLRTTEVPIGRRVCGSTGLGATLSRLSQSIFEEAERMREDEGAVAVDAYFEILAACMGGSPTVGQRVPDLQGRIRRFIDAHLSEPTLAADEIACAIGISVRHLHRVFAVTGRTLGDCIRSRRLENCRCDLANPRSRERTITEIAFSWGFNDSAHFSHSFRKQFGISPRTFRTQSATRGRDTLRAEMREVEVGDEGSFEFRHSKPN